MSYHGHARSLKTVTDICLLDEDAEVDMGADLVGINKIEGSEVEQRRAPVLCLYINTKTPPFSRFLHIDRVLLYYLCTS